MTTAPAHAHVDDAGFVRAPAWLVYRRLTDLEGWPHWWPRCRVRRLTPSTGEPSAQRYALDVAVRPLWRLRVAARPHAWRHDLGFSLAVEGDVDGAVELWLEQTHGGTVVHHLANLRAAGPRPVSTLAGYRRAFRCGLWGLKDALHLEARTSAGLTP